MQQRAGRYARYDQWDPSNFDDPNTGHYYATSIGRHRGKDTEPAPIETLGCIAVTVNLFEKPQRHRPHRPD